MERGMPVTCNAQPLLCRRRTIHVLWMLLLLVFGGCSLLGITEREPKPVVAPRVTESGLTYHVISEGDGPFPQEGDLVRIHYEGQLSDGSVFGSSYDRSEPVEIRFGEDHLLPGLRESLAFFREGTKARIVIPPELAYGETGLGPVPENETLTFTVEVLRVLAPERAPEPDAMVWQETDSGVKYSLIREGSGSLLSPPVHITVDYAGYLDDEEQTLFDSSYEREEPLEFVLGTRAVIPGWEVVLPELRVGDAARIWVPHAMAYGKQGRGPIPPETDLVFDIEILDAREAEIPRPFDTAGKDTLQTMSGLQYILIESGSGETPNPGNVLTVHYSAYWDDGTLFDSSVQRSEPLRFVIGTGQVIQGLDEALFLFPRGTKARIIVPPGLAYGEEGSGVVPPETTLIFDVELMDIDR